jgi:hypothetical protein
MSMTAAKQIEWISAEDYLAGKFDSEVKHEYLGGNVYAMAGVDALGRTQPIDGSIHWNPAGF